MAEIPGVLHRALAAFLALCGACGVLFALDLLFAAVSGRDTPSSFLLGGFGFILLLLSVVMLVLGVRQWTHPKPG